MIFSNFTLGAVLLAGGLFLAMLACLEIGRRVGVVHHERFALDLAGVVPADCRRRGEDRHHQCRGGNRDRPPA